MPEAQALPIRPDIHWYKKAAKRRLDQLRAHHPETKLADAQLEIAREHGFSSWRKLKDHIDQLADLPTLFDAIRHEDRAAMRTLLKGNPRLVRLANTEGQTAIHLAAERNKSMQLNCCCGTELILRPILERVGILRFPGR